MTQSAAQSAASRRRTIGFALAFFLWTAVLLAVVKLLLAQAVGSLSLFACALHSLLLCFSALLGIQALGQPRQPQWLSSPESLTRFILLEGGTGRLATLMALLLWALLGFGCFSLLGEMLRRGTSGWTTEATTLPMELFGTSPHVSRNLSNLSDSLPGAISSSSVVASSVAPVGLNATVSHSALLPLLAILAVLGFGLAFLSQLCARSLSNRALAFQSYLLLQDGWLVLIAGVALLALGQGVAILESLGALGILAMVVADGWRWLEVHMPHWFQSMAIAPEAIAATAQQVDGVIGCRVLFCRGLVGRRLAIALELRLHPDFDDLRYSLSRRVCRNLERRYGPAQVDIYLVAKPGGPRRKLNLSLEDEVSWVDGTDDGTGDAFGESGEGLR